LDQCHQCKTKGEIRFVFVNGHHPTWLCQDCLAQIPQQGQARRRQYKQGPAKLWQGALAGLFISLLSGAVLGWGSVQSSQTDLANDCFGLLLVSWILLIPITRGIVIRLGTKPTRRSLLVTGVSTILGPFLGYWGTLFAFVTFDPSLPEQTKRSLSNVLRGAWGLSLLGVFLPAVLGIPWLVSMWKNRRAHLELEFNPVVELVNGAELIVEEKRN
jgi:hypothetical protein